MTRALQRTPSLEKRSRAIFGLLMATLIVGIGSTFEPLEAQQLTTWSLSYEPWKVEADGADVWYTSHHIGAGNVLGRLTRTNNSFKAWSLPSIDTLGLQGMTISKVGPKRIWVTTHFEHLGQLNPYTNAYKQYNFPSTVWAQSIVEDPVSGYIYFGIIATFGQPRGSAVWVPSTTR